MYDRYNENSSKYRKGRDLGGRPQHSLGLSEGIRIFYVGLKCGDGIPSCLEAYFVKQPVRTYNYIDPGV